MILILTLATVNFAHAGQFFDSDSDLVGDNLQLAFDSGHPVGTLKRGDIAYDVRDLSTPDYALIRCYSSPIDILCALPGEASLKAIPARQTCQQGQLWWTKGGACMPACGPATVFATEDVNGVPTERCVNADE